MDHLVHGFHEMDIETSSEEDEKELKHWLQHVIQERDLIPNRPLAELLVRNRFCFWLEGKHWRCMDPHTDCSFLHRLLHDSAILTESIRSLGIPRYLWRRMQCLD